LAASFNSFSIALRSSEHAFSTAAEKSSLERLVSASAVAPS
jgi:hypothetical protein